MRVLLTHGYFINEDENEQKIMRPYPPLGVLYISAFLEENNVPNEVHDATFSSRERLFKHIHEYKPDIVAIYTNLMTKVSVIEIIQKIKLSSSCKVVLGGPDVTYNVPDYLTNGADFLVIGEGEATMLELVQCFEKNKPFRSVNGIAFLDDHNQVVQTGARNKLRSVDELPIPNRRAIDIQKYLDTWKVHHGKSALNVSTQRGCPYTCKWCSTAVYGQSYRRRSPENVVEELKQIRDQYNPDSIWFVDDVFTVSHKWLSEMADVMDKHDIHIPFECISRADRMNLDVIKILKRMGCFRVWIGAESGSQRIIDAMDRRVSVEQVREMIIETRKVGIEAGTFIMLGYPGETEEDIFETINHLKIAEPDHFTITLAYPIKGTELYEEIESEIITENNWSISTDRDVDFKRTYGKSYYKYALKKVVNEINYHKMKDQKGIKKFIPKLKSISAGVGMKLLK